MPSRLLVTTLGKPRRGGGQPVELPLPLRLDFTGGWPGAPDWTFESDGDGTPAISTIAADAVDGFTPGTSPVLRPQITGDTVSSWLMIEYFGLRNNNLSFDLTQGIRIQALTRVESQKRRAFFLYFLANRCTTIMNGTAVMGGSNTDKSSPNDEVRLTEYVDGTYYGTFVNEDPGLGRNLPDFDEHWVEMNFELTPNAAAMKFHERLPHNGSTTSVISVAPTHEWSGETFDAIAMMFTDWSWTDLDARLAHLWLGTSDDAWPTE